MPIWCLAAILAALMSHSTLFSTLFSNSSLTLPPSSSRLFFRAPAQVHTHTHTHTRVCTGATNAASLPLGFPRGGVVGQRVALFLACVPPWRPCVIWHPRPRVGPPRSPANQRPRPRCLQRACARRVCVRVCVVVTPVCGWYVCVCVCTSFCVYVRCIR